MGDARQIAGQAREPQETRTAAKPDALRAQPKAFPLTADGSPPPPLLRGQQQAWAMTMQRALGNRATAQLMGASLGRGGSVRSRFAVQPHTSSSSALREQCAIYSRGQTPITNPNGQVEAVNMTPSDAQTAGRHLAEVKDHFGHRGLAQSIHGLGVTRGWAFADAAVQRAPTAVRTAGKPMLTGANIGDTPQGNIVGGRVSAAAASAIQRSTPAGGLPASTRAQLEAPLGEGVGGVRIHRDSAAHEAARLLDARAFTVGRSIYFGEGEYQPSTKDGSQLLAHEVAHTVQQAGATIPALDALTISSPSSAEEVEADRFAEAVVREHGEAPASTEAQVARAPRIRQGTSGVARLMRVISFTHANDTFTVNHPGSDETANTFQIAQGVPAAPHFQWDTDVTIHGNAGDPFANFEVGPHQLVRDFWLNIFWGSGANQSHFTSHVATPIRDSVAAADIWYANSLVSPAFGAAGDVRHTNLNDTPGILNQPFANPVAPRVSTTGFFNWGMAFVSFISARDTTAGTGAGAFRHLGHVYWNLSLAGNFDTARAVGSRIRRTDGGRTNRSGVIEGRSAEFPTMHGGDIFNDQANANATTT